MLIALFATKLAGFFTSLFEVLDMRAAVGWNSLTLNGLLHMGKYIYIYIYIYMCVCVCVCVYKRKSQNVCVTPFITQGRLYLF